MKKQINVLVLVALILASSFLTVNFAQAITLDDSSSATGVVNSITLSGSGSDINWEVDGYSARGFKISWSKNSGPTYPLRTGDKYHYFSSPSKDSDTLTAFDGAGTYYVRVCEYLGGKCGVYSNEITLTLGDTSSDGSNINAVTGITLSGNGSGIEWDVDGYSAKGFKVSWSKNSGPTYPLRTGDKYHYFSNPNQSADTLTDFSGAGTYYVRVCEYLGGKCGKYSNEITLTLGDTTSDDSDEDDGYFPERLVEIKLSGSGSEIEWIADGISEKGFKVVWSKNSNPTYPLRSGDKYHYYSSSSREHDTLTAFDGDGMYYVRVCEYLGGKCGVYSNEITVDLTKEKAVACTMEYAPVCGKDGKTYSNKCVAEKGNGVHVAYTGECKKDEETEEIEDKASKLLNDDVSGILAELKKLRDLVKEQAAQLTHLKKLMTGVKAVAQGAQDAINNFIAYGVDENTEKLGEGERAAVMYSFKSAFKKLPETENELADAIKIANGRWPSMTSEEAEKRAKEMFQKIYKRIADMDDEKDNAAITVMAYGLRQKAENRNLESEKNGIKTFMNIFGYHPETTEDWNVMQAITYSGASRGADADGDLLTDEREAELGTDPKNPDTDGDGHKDGIEVANGYDPLKAD